MFLSTWRSVTDDKTILETVSGYKIPFSEIPKQCYNSPPKGSFSKEDNSYIFSELQRLEKNKAIRKCKSCKGQFISNIFLIPKSSGGKRLILNLKELNKYVITHHFKMEDIRTAVRLMTPDCFMVNLDLKEAYFLVPIHETHTKFLRFIFNETLYEFLVLPFGLASAPFVYTKITKPITAYLRERGYKSVQYLDDYLCMGEDRKECKSNLSETVVLLESLGFVINHEKSMVMPSKSCTFLGFILNSDRMTLELPLKKKQDILTRTENMLQKDTLTIRSFAQYLGTLTAACPAVAYGWLHTKSLERAKYLALLNSNDNYDAAMQVTSNLCDDLLWWKSNIRLSSSRIRSGNFMLEIFSDASSIGWGAACGKEKIGGSWSVEEVSCHINYLELLAAYFGLKSFTANLQDCQILLRIDNTTAISYINRMGGVQYPHLNHITRKIWSWCETRNIHLFASYIKSCLNRDADDQSRNIDIEWELGSYYYKRIISKFGEPEIDLFASRINNKCKRYISWKRDPYAYDIDAFTVDWNKFFFYAFPPFSLILKVLQKIRNDNATGILVVPFWPSQPWFPVFQSLTVGEVLIFSPNIKLLSSNFRQTHPLHRHLSLAASVLSGNHLRNDKFRNQP